ncbi:MAG: Blue (Type 1) copper protein [Thermoplasmatales archaeon Gpl]|jgi:rusticyanin|nr:MAG: Blue (Type 1) copper protein [Thermoplasmatales archaeon Gpl]
MDRNESGKTESGIMLQLFAIIAVVIVLVILVFATLSAALSATYGTGAGNGSYGSGMPSSGTSSAFTINNTSFNKINTLPAGVLVNNSTNTINVTSRDVTLVLEAAPTWYPRQGDFWLAYGLVNPNIVMGSGTTIHFVFINMDNITHMPAITTISPPYSYMPMQDGMMGSGTGSGSGMMGYQNNGTGTWPAIGPMLLGTSVQVPDPAYSATNLSVTFNSPDTFWYICLVPGHAQMGMYGKISVIGA